MKKILLLSVLIIGTKAHSNVDFCKSANLKAKLSKEASENKGMLKKRIKRPGDKIPKTRRFFFRGCRHDIKWMKRVRSTLCDNDIKKSQIEKENLSEIQLPKMIFFMFDGAADFNAERGNSINAVNLDGTEGNDLGYGNANGLRQIIRQVNDQDTILGKNWNNIQFHYHTASGFKGRENQVSAEKCMKEMANYITELRKIDKSIEMPKLTFMGYSNGAYMGLAFQKKMSDLGISFDLVFTVDPVEQTLFFYPGKLKKFRGKKAKNTKRLINFYQLDDFGSLPPLKLRGRPVKGADINLKLSYLESSSMYETGQYSHVTILRTQQVDEVLNCEMNNVLFGEKQKCKY